MKQWRRVASQTQFMTKAEGTVTKAEGIGQLQRSEKSLYANLKQLREAHATAEEAYRQQRLLRSKQTNEKLKQHHME